jgi:hypothetical protein
MSKTQSTYHMPDIIYSLVLINVQWKTIGKRTRGRPRKRWIAGNEEDLQIMGIRWWRKQCEERAEWKKITEMAKTHSWS